MKRNNVKLEMSAGCLMIFLCVGLFIAALLSLFGVSGLAALAYTFSGLALFAVCSVGVSYGFYLIFRGK